MTETRVLWLIKGLARGGAERLVTLMAPRFDPERFDVEVAYLLPQANDFVEELETSGVRTLCLGARRSADPRWVPRLRRLLEQGRYDLVHTHSPMPAAVARLLARAPTRLVHTEHNLWSVYRWPTYAANALTYSRNARAIAVSDGVAESIKRPRWARVGPLPPVETLLHGVDPASAPRGPAARSRARADLGLDDDTPVIGNVANFSPKKDHAGLLEAFEQVRSRVPGAVLLLIGMGPLEATLRAEVASRGLQDSVRFLGSRHDVPQLLPAFDVFVLGSRYEGLPISLLEAMSAEIPCVATAVGGIPEAITDGVEGRLVPPGDPLALANTLSQVLVDHDERRALAAAGRERVISGFSISRAAQRTQSLYSALVSQPR